MLVMRCDAIVCRQERQVFDKTKVQFSSFFFAIAIPKTEACPVSQFRISRSGDREACFQDSDIFFAGRHKKGGSANETGAEQ